MENRLLAQSGRPFRFIRTAAGLGKKFKNSHPGGFVELEILLWTGIFTAFMISLIQIHTKAISFHKKQLEEFTHEWNRIQ